MFQQRFPVVLLNHVPKQKNTESIENFLQRLKMLIQGETVPKYLLQLARQQALGNQWHRPQRCFIQKNAYLEIYHRKLS